MIDSKLPITTVLPDIIKCLEERDELVLQAPPGAGKTTLVPLALMGQSWLSDKKILLLEPRRVAARNAAFRMADMLGQNPGGSVGYRMRLDTCVGASTVVEVITEGILNRMLQSDPSLEDIGLIIFDEFHERNLESDLALALTLQGRSIFRDANAPLKILIMSATLDGKLIAELLDDAPIIESLGKQYSVDLTYIGAKNTRDPIVDRTIPVVLRALEENPESSILVFLPGQAEIRGVADRLKNSDAHIRPLYGNLSMEEQQLALMPEASGRKVVLATNIAESSLTIEDVDVVIDSGLAREPRFDPNTGMTRLQTIHVARSSTTQRAGRAGRLSPGRCYRLWSEDQQHQLPAQSTPEIINADLAPVVLQVLHWGNPEDVKWLDQPPSSNWNQARKLLSMLGAIQTDKSNNKDSLSPHGEAMLDVAAHPRIAHMLLCAVGDNKMFQLAIQLAAILSDRDPFRETPDIAHRIAVLNEKIPCPPRYRGWRSRTTQLAKKFRSQLAAQQIGASAGSQLSESEMLAYLIASAYPDRIARQRHAGGYQLANGRSANFDQSHGIGKAKWLAVAEVGGYARNKGDVIYSATPLDENLFHTLLADLVRIADEARWDDKASRFIAEQQSRIGALVLETKKREPDAEMKRNALLQLVRQKGLNMLPWTADCHQFRGRIVLLKSISGHDWPDLSDNGLLTDLDTWLGPYLDPIKHISGFKKLDLLQILRSLLTYQQLSQMEGLAPERLCVPSGSRIKIDYRENPPVLAVKLQEMFGVTQTPTIADGSVELLVHLLSPAGRPLQVTQDLAGFWRNAYVEVKKEMKGRYPKHSWPDDPLSAIPTHKTR